MRSSSGRGRCSFSVPTTEATHSLRFERRRSREGDRPHAFPPHFPRCLLRDGRGRPAQQEKTEAGLTQGPPEGGATPIWISAPLQGDRGEVHPLGGEPEEGGRR